MFNFFNENYTHPNDTSHRINFNGGGDTWNDVDPIPTIFDTLNDLREKGKLSNCVVQINTGEETTWLKVGQSIIEEYNVQVELVDPTTDGRDGKVILKRSE